DGPAQASPPPTTGGGGPRPKNKNFPSPGVKSPSSYSERTPAAAPPASSGALLRSPSPRPSCTRPVPRARSAPWVNRDLIRTHYTSDRLAPGILDALAEDRAPVLPSLSGRVVNWFTDEDGLLCATTSVAAKVFYVPESLLVPL